MYDPMRDLLAELATSPSVTAIVGDRIRRWEPAPGDARGPGEWVPFVVLVRLGGSRERGRVPLQQVPIGIRCYGATDHEATMLAGAVADALDNRGPRGPVYRTYAPEVGGTVADPDTRQPYVEVLVEAYARKE